MYILYTNSESEEATDDDDAGSLAPEMRVWDKGYDEHGFWSIPRARAAAAAERARATQAGPKKRKQKQPSYWRTKEGKAQVADKLAGAAIGASVPSRKRQGAGTLEPMRKRQRTASAASAAQGAGTSAPIGKRALPTTASLPQPSRQKGSKAPMPTPRRLPQLDDSDSDD